MAGPVRLEGKSMESASWELPNPGMAPFNTVRAAVVYAVAFLGSFVLDESVSRGRDRVFSGQR